MNDLDLRDQFWHLICHRSELPKQGDFLRLNWLGQDIVVCNDADNLLVFDNVCPHRGSRFFSEFYGNAPISCPYHGWNFQNGRLHIPCIEKFSQEDLRDVNLRQWRSDWCGDFLFVSPRPLVTLENQLAGLFDKLASISMDIHGRADWNAYSYECNWKIAIENALDALHVPFVHPTSLGRLNLSEPKDEYMNKNSAVYFRILDVSYEKKLRRASKAFQLGEQYEGYMSLYLFPFSMLSSTFGYSYSLQNFFPAKERNRTNFYSRLLKSNLAPSFPPSGMDHFFSSTALVNRQVFEEDHVICQQIDMSGYDIFQTRMLSVDEAKIAHFRQSLQSLDYQDEY